MINEQPLFTIFTLCYNHAPFLNEYFHGLLSQTYEKVQLIIHDDCSTDGSWDIIQSYLPQVKEKFAEVICERSETNQGMWGAFLRVSDPRRIRGKYVSLLESDDYYFPERIAKVVEYLEHNTEVGFVHSGVLVANHRKKENHTLVYDPEVNKVEGWVFNELLEVNFAAQCTIAFRYDTYRQIDRHRIAAKGYLMCDYPINLAMAKLAPVGYIQEVLACYRVHPGSASRPKNPLRQYEFGKSIHRISLDTAREAGVSETIIHRLQSRFCYSQFRQGFVVGRFEECEDAVTWLLQKTPNQLMSFGDRLRLFMLSHKALREPFRRFYYSRILVSIRKSLHTLLMSVTHRGKTELNRSSRI